MVLCFVLFDAAALPLGLEDSRFYLIPLLLSVAMTFYGFAHARRLSIKEYTVPVPGQGQNFKLSLLSDIHAGVYVDRKQLHKIAAAVNRVGADMVVMAGDTFDQDAFGRCDLAAVKSELLTLKPKGGIYAVLGNPDRKSLAELLSGLPSDKPKIVIDHNPVGIDEGVEQGADLVLCGHTHKGQFFPATLFTKLAYGARGFYGHAITEHTHSIVSAGAGYFQLPIRIGTNSEIVVVRVEFQGETRPDNGM